jgi:hypothetical protein
VLSTHIFVLIFGPFSARRRRDDVCRPGYEGEGNRALAAGVASNRDASSARSSTGGTSGRPSA